MGVHDDGVFYVLHSRTFYPVLQQSLDEFLKIELHPHSGWFRDELSPILQARNEYHMPLSALRLR